MIVQKPRLGDFSNTAAAVTARTAAVVFRTPTAAAMGLAVPSATHSSKTMKGKHYRQAPPIATAVARAKRR